jgi:hypothetical protein
MFRYLVAFLLLVHGLIHFMGLAKAFGWGNMTQLTKTVSKPSGLLWATAAVLFLLAVLLVLLKKEAWWMAGLPAVVLSQFLIISVWHDARFGTFANAILLVAVLLSVGSWRFENGYKKEVQAGLNHTRQIQNSMLTDANLEPLPLPVQRYLRYAGVVGKPKVTNVKIVFEGMMRERGKDWFPFTSEQYNFFDKPTRLFFMKAKMFGIQVPGYHAYRNGKASMQIKAFGLFPLVNAKEGELDKAETVTLFNDMCLLAPATLIDKRIQWEAVDPLTAKAVFTTNGIRISALLYFNEHGQLVNFVSDDRYAIADRKQYQFSTPVGDYQNRNGYNLCGYGEAVWHYPDGAFTYGKFYLKTVVYNCQ